MSVCVYSSTVVLSGEVTLRVRMFIFQEGASRQYSFLKKDHTCKVSSVTVRQSSEYVSPV